MNKPYDSTWHDDWASDAFKRKYQQWQERDWQSWLEQQLVFPFEVKRDEDDDDAYFSDVAKHQPFRLGHTFTVVAIEMDDDWRGIIVKAREGSSKGHVPLCDLEVTSNSDENYWPVREYVIWYANR